MSNSDTYGKVFSSIFDSSLIADGGWLPTYVMAGLIAIADKDGLVKISPKNIHNRFGFKEGEMKVEYKLFEKALQFLQKEDPESESDAFEGKRIIALSDIAELEGNRGFWIVNYDLYLKKASRLDKKNNTAARVKKFRDNKNNDLQECNAVVTHGNAKKSNVTQKKRIVNASDVHIDIDIDIDDKTTSCKESLSCQEVFDSFNRICKKLTTATEFPPERQKAAEHFIVANRLDLEKIETYFKAVNEDPYFQGKATGRIPAGFDVVVKAITQAKFNEGFYNAYEKKTTYDKSNAELARVENDLRIEEEALAEHLQDREKNIAFPESSTRATIQTLKQQIKNLKGGVK